MIIKETYIDRVVFQDDSNNITSTFLNAIKHGVHLTRCGIQGLVLQDVDLSYSDFSGCYFLDCIFQDVYMNNTNFTDTRFTNSCFHNCNLRQCKFNKGAIRGSAFINSVLKWSDLEDTEIDNYTDFKSTSIEGAKFPAHFQDRFQICPEGELIVYKKLLEGICKLKIPQEAARVNSISSRKCRASEAIVLELPHGCTIGHSQHNPKFIYEVGKKVVPEFGFSNDWRVTCAGGIHFFLTRKEAEMY